MAKSEIAVLKNILKVYRSLLKKDPDPRRGTSEILKANLSNTPQLESEAKVASFPILLAVPWLTITAAVCFVPTTSKSSKSA
jgi:hypothetical protein